MSIKDEFPQESELHLDSVLANAYTRLRARAIEMERALQWAQGELGKHTRPSPIDKALARIDAKGKETV